jgi:ubiquinone/menaquinone biosynthesis C-methylase UbiE
MLEIRHEKMEDSAHTLEAYNEIYRQDDLLQRDSFYLWLLGLLKPEADRILLDISCGQGRLVTLAKARGVNAIGLDFAVQGLYKGYRDSPEAGWVAGDGENLPVRGESIDYITHIGSLEHYLDPEAGAREIARVLKPSGKACILLPNAFGLLGNIKHVMREGEIFDDRQPLQRYATRKTWERLLCIAGLRIEKTIDYGEIEFPRTVKDLMWFARHPQKIIRYVLCHFIPFNLTNHFVFLCARDQ